MIFISHKETDSALAKQLVGFLRVSLELPSTSIRCTSVPGYQLPFGETISGQLKNDISASSAVFVIITRASLLSRWVLFELGAAWALGKVIVPILGPGLSQSDLPGPLSEYPIVRSDDANAVGRLRDAIAQIARELSLVEKGGGEAQSGLDAFLSALRAWTTSTLPGVQQAMAFQLSWLLTVLLMKAARQPSAVRAEVEVHSADLGLRLPSGWFDRIAADDSGQALMDLIGELGGQLVARHPDLSRHFEAGFNILFGAAKSDPVSLGATISTLDLPNELRQPTGNILRWVNRVHDYYEAILREHAG